MSESTTETIAEKMSKLDKQIAELKAKRARVARADYERVGKRLREAGATDTDVDSIVKLYAAGRMSESLAKLVAMLDADAPKKDDAKANSAAEKPAEKQAPAAAEKPARTTPEPPKSVAPATAPAPRPLTPTEKAAASSEANANRMLERMLKH